MPLRRDRAYLYTYPERELTEIEWLHYGRYLHQRLKGMPTQYITRTQEFYGRPFLVNPDVLIPRPETEHVVEAALSAGGHATRFLDVGCGSGAIAITLQLETGAEVWASDISLAALGVAATNATRLGAHVFLIAGDLVSAIADRSIDVLVSNPPYVAAAELAALAGEVRDHEPSLALSSGPTGFEIYERLIPEARRVLRPRGPPRSSSLATIAVAGCWSCWRTGSTTSAYQATWPAFRGLYRADCCPENDLSPRYGCVLRVRGGAVRSEP